MKQAIGSFAVHYAAPVVFLVVAVCLAGGYSALHMPSAVFPQADFPRVVILADTGVTPADEMMMNVTRPIEEAVKDVPGCTTVRSATGRGSAQIDVFFDWGTDMVRTELAVSTRLAELHSTLPVGAKVSVHRMTFSAFPIIGLSLTSPKRPTTDLWQWANFTVKPQLLRIGGIANVELVGGRAPEIQVKADPVKLLAANLSLQDLCDALRTNNQIVSTGLHEQGHELYLTAVDGRLHDVNDVRNFTIAVPSSPTLHVRLGDIATVSTGPEPIFNRVTANGQDAVLLNIYSQPDASTLAIADALRQTMREVRPRLPGDVKVDTFYDQSLLVRASVGGVWEAIGFGLILSVAILYLFLRNWGTVLVTAVVIPVSVLCTIAVMKLTGMSFNLMTLGGIAAAIGLVIDDAIVVVEAIYAQLSETTSRPDAVRAGLSEIFAALLGSTITPVVVFVPLAFLDGISGVFFRALALTMTVSLLTSLVLALTLTPSLAAWLVGHGSIAKLTDPQDARVGGIFMRSIIVVYEYAIRLVLRHQWFSLGICFCILAATAIIYGKLKSDFLPPIDEGGFVIDYISSAGSSMSELDGQMRQVEDILAKTPEVQSWSRRTGAALGVGLVEPNTGDFLVKLRSDRKRSTEDVLVDVRQKINAAQPRIKWAFPGILTDLIGDLTWEDEPIEVKLFSANQEDLLRLSRRAAKDLSYVNGVTDVNDGLTFTGSSLHFTIRPFEARAAGLNTADVGSALTTAMTGQVASSILQPDQTINIRVQAAPEDVQTISQMGDLPIRTPAGQIVHLSQVATPGRTPGELELHRDDLRENVTVLAELDNRDLGSAMMDVRNKLDHDPELSSAHIEYGGLYEQQVQAFKNLIVVLIIAIVLVFAVAVLEFRSFRAPIAIVFGAVLSAFGIVLMIRWTGTTLNIVTFLGALIGMGIVHKNGILMIDYVEQLRSEGIALLESVVLSGRRRLRPVLMTSLAAAMGMLPLALGAGSGADLLRPLGVAVIGAVCGSVLMSLVATPLAYYVMYRGSDGTRPFGTPLKENDVI
jgi:CzcA family heavy metal efflux pump